MGVTILVDVVIVLFILFHCFIYSRRGLVLSAISVLSLVIEIGCGVLFNTPVREMLEKTAIYPKILDYSQHAVKAFEDGLESGLQNKAAAFIDKAESNSNIPSYITDYLKSFIPENTGNEQLGEQIAHVIMSVLAFILILCVVSIVIGIIKAIVLRVRRLDLLVLSQLDTIGGATLGFIVSVTLVCTIIFCLGCLSAFGAPYVDFVQESFIGGFLYRNNIVGYIIAAIFK